MKKIIKKTPLNSVHKKSGAKMIEFGGWEMPVRYKGIIAEHNVTREKAGIFDVSHMGEILINGDKALDELQYLVTNDVSRLKKGQILYTPMCNNSGGVVDDVLIYCKKEREVYLLVVNAANTDKDFEWIKDNIHQENVNVVNISDKTGQISLQGPFAEKILQKVADYNLKNMKHFWFEEDIEIKGVKCIVSRTGYTGEDGFEIYIPWERTELIWNLLLEIGKDNGLEPCGLGARDTLRLEACLPLYGHELRENLTPVAAGLTRFVKLDKGDFLGKDAIEEELSKGPEYKLVAFEMLERGIPRSGYKIVKDDDEVGFVTSGSYSPTLRKNVGLGYVKTEAAKTGEEIHILIRNKKVKAKIVKKPFYNREV